MAEIPTSAPLPVPDRALAIVAHPDDAELRAGATLARWAADGCEVSVLVCTDGSRGTWDPSRDPAELAAIRQVEQRGALEVLTGGRPGECVFLGRVDGELDSGRIEREPVVAAIRRLRPVVVVAHDPWKRYRLHPDHRHAGLLAVEGIVAARDPLFFPGVGPAPWRPDHLLLFEADEVDHVEPTAPAWIERKLEALLVHRSQFRSTHGIVDPDDPADVGAFRERITRLTKGGEPFHLLSEL